MICLECKKDFSTLLALSKHITKTEKISLSQYYDKYILKHDKKCCICKIDDRNFLNLRLGYSDTCKNKKCINSNNELKRQKSNLMKYGVTNTSQVDWVKEKRTNTFLNKFGTNTPLQNTEISKKLSKTFQEKDHNFWKDRYSKIKKTCFQKYGVDNVNKLEFVKLKKVLKSLKKYGTTNPLQSDEIKNKLKNTCIQKYGVDHPLKSPIIQENNKKILFDKYGYDNFSKSPMGKRILRKRLLDSIKQKYNIGIITPTIGIEEKKCLDELSAIFQIEIERNIEIIGYFPDGYVRNKNLIIEFYEPEHNRQTSKFRDFERQTNLQNHLQCKFYIIWQKEWQMDKQKILNDIQNLLVN